MSTWLYKITRLILGSIFIYAGGSKLLEPEIFATLIDAYGVVPEVLLMPTAVTLPILEVIAGIGLVFDIRGSLLVITGLLVLFIAVLSYGIWMGLDVDCGCFGPEDPEAKAFHDLRPTLYRDLIMMLGISFLYGWRQYRNIRPIMITSIMNKRIGKRRMKDAYG
jgi:uncharacterized membrane protein